MAEFKPVEGICIIESSANGTGVGIRVVKELVRCKDCMYRTVNPKWRKGCRQLKAICELDTGDSFELARNAEDDEWYCADAVRRKE